MAKGIMPLQVTSIAVKTAAIKDTICFANLLTTDLKQEYVSFDVNA